MVQSVVKNCKNPLKGVCAEYARTMGTGWVQGFARIYKDLQGSVMIHKDLHGFARIYNDSQGFERIGGSVRFLNILIFDTPSIKLVNVCKDCKDL